MLGVNVLGVKRFLTLCAVMVLAACGAKELAPVSQGEIARLEARILALGPEVDAEEAARAARIALFYPRQLRAEYGVTDGPLVHNTKVNAGTRPRGLCWHWAEDMQKRLAFEAFQTLDLHRAIANSDVAFRIDHSTVLISAAGDTMQEALILDPWRFGGELYVGTLEEDVRYKWLPQTEVLRKRAEKQAREGW